MTEFDITASYSGIDFAPGSVAAEVYQNVHTILKTRKGTVPLDRGFGIDWSFVDLPVQIARARAFQEVVEKIATYEPRAEVVGVEFGDGEIVIDGRLNAKVRIVVNE